MKWLMFISDVFSVITIALSFILKVPQIVRLIRAKDASGISLNALFLEVSSYTITMMYNYCNNHALLSYLEYPIIVLQEYVVIACVFQFKNSKPMSFVYFLLIHISVVLLFALNIADSSILAFLLPLTTPVSATSKIIQLLEMMRTKNAQSVSVSTWFLSFFTNATRIYTTYMDSADPFLLLNFTISAGLSGAVMLAAIYYQRKQVVTHYVRESSSPFVRRQKVQ